MATGVAKGGTEAQAEREYCRTMYYHHCHKQLPNSTFYLCTWRMERNFATHLYEDTVLRVDKTRKGEPYPDKFELKV